MMNGAAALREQLRVMAIIPDMPPELEVICELARSGLQAGATSLQYRNKLDSDPENRLAVCRALQTICRERGALFIVNDDPLLAHQVGADGVHLGPADMPVAQARRILGPGVVIGASAGNSERARVAVNEGADYLGVGAIFDASASKADASAPVGPALLERLREDPLLGDIPIVAIGGISVANAGACIRAGADGVATIRGIFSGAAVNAQASELVSSVRAAL